jgi:acetyl-CoA acetyltransferase
LTAARHWAGRGQVAIAGYAHSRVQRHLDLPLGALAIDVARAAVADAGLTMQQIDGFTTGSLFPSSGGRRVVDGEHTVTADWLVEHLGVHPRWVCGFQGIGQVVGALILAATAIATGAADYVLLHRALYNPPGRYHENPMTEAGGDDQWTAPQGYWGPVTPMALAYTEYMQRYGARREDMAQVVVESRRIGSTLPWSVWYRKPLTVQQYLEAKMVSEPLSVLDCDMPVSGVAAFVLTSARRAADLPHPPVYLAGFAQGRSRPRNGIGYWDLDEIHAGGRELADRLWTSAGIGHDEVDLPQMYDGFSPCIYFWLEALGYCKPGESPQLVRDGVLGAGAGKPFLSSGGALGSGRMHGIPQMLECYLQLSRRAGDRQLDRAEVGLATQATPNFGGAVVYTSFAS